MAGAVVPLRPPVGARFSNWTKNSLWPIALAYAAVVFPLVVRSSGGSYVGDNRFEVYWNPGRRISRSFAIWDGTRGLGRVREDFWPGATAPVALFRAIGLSPWVAEAAFHTLLIVLLATGVAATLRLFRPVVGPEHALAGAIAIVSPYVVGFLLPSQLFMHVAGAPWLAVFAFRGVHSSQPWRWAAAFALVIFCFGNTDPPGAVLALLPAVMAIAYSTLVSRTASLRAAIGWLARAGFLSFLVSFVALMKMFLAAATFAQRLNDTETPETAAITSSWAESWRGMGFWLLYFRDATGLARPQAAWYSSGLLAVGATFIVPLMAVGTVWAGRARERLLLAGMVVASLVLMVGGFPLEDPPPLGAAILRLIDVAPLFAAFRNTYKAGAGMIIGLSVLASLGFTYLAGALADRSRTAGRAFSVAVWMLIVFLGRPMLAGDIYDADATMREVPQYWLDAIDWLDNGDSSEGRVLILPGVTRAQYRWGWPGDDLFDALLTRDHAIDTSIPLSTPRAAGLLRTLSGLLEGGDDRSSELATIAARLGMDTVVIRNDLKWEDWSAPRPVAFDPIRESDRFELVATFGEEGKFTVSPDDRTSAAVSELRLPPIEVYRLTNETLPYSRSSDPGLIVSGGADVWSEMASWGLLDDPAPVRYSADLNDDDLGALLGGGATVVVSDTNRRRLEIVAGFVSESTHTLAEGVDLDRPSADLFQVSGSQTVATYGDAVRIGSTAKARGIAGFEPWFRPSNAFDGLKETSWRIRVFDNPIGNALRVDFESPQTIGGVEMESVGAGRSGNHIGRVVLNFSDGSRELVDLDDGVGEATFREREVEWVEVEILGLVGDLDPMSAVGFQEIRFEAIDLAEYIRLPDDLLRASDRAPALSSGLGSAPFEILLTRLEGTGPFPDELVMRRAFWSKRDAEFTMSGFIRLDRHTPEWAISALSEAPMNAVASERLQGGASASGVNVLDGDASTSWQVSPDAASTLIMDAPEGAQALAVTALSGNKYSRVTEVEITRGEARSVADLTPNSACTAGSSGDDCRSVGTITIPPGNGPISLRVSGVERRQAEGLTARPIAISEVVVQGAAVPMLDRATGTQKCNESILQIDGEPVPVRITANLADVLAGETVAFEACAAVELEAGWHRIDTAPTGNAVASIRLSEEQEAPPSSKSSPPEVSLISMTAGTRQFRIRAPEGGVLLTGESWDRGWVATLDGVDLGAAEPVDTLSGWSIPPVDDAVLTARYLPSRTLDRAMLITGFGLALCLGMLLLVPASREEAVWVEGVVQPRVGVPPAFRWMMVAVAIVFGAAAAGVNGAVVGGAAAVAGVMSPRMASKPAALGAGLFLIAAMLATLAVGPLTAEAIRLDFPRRRMFAAQSGAVAGVLLMVSVLLGSLEERSRSFVGPSRSDRSSSFGFTRAGDLVRRWLPVVIAGATAGALRLLFGPDPVSDELAALVEGLAQGTPLDSSGAARGLFPGGILALSPLPARLVASMLAAGIASVAAALAGAGSGGGRRALAVGLLVAAVPSVWGLGVPELVAALFLGSAIWAANSWRIHRNPHLIGVLLVAAILGRPEAILGLPLVMSTYRRAGGPDRLVILGWTAIGVGYWVRLCLTAGAGVLVASPDSVDRGPLVMVSALAIVLAPVGWKLLTRRGDRLARESQVAVALLALLVVLDVPWIGGRGFAAALAPVVLTWLIVQADLRVTTRGSGSYGARETVKGLRASR